MLTIVTSFMIKLTCNNLEESQYNAVLVITGAIKQTSRLEIYKQLSNKSMKFRR